MCTIILMYTAMHLIPVVSCMQQMTVMTLHVLGIQCVLQQVHLNQSHQKRDAIVALVSIAVHPVKV